MIAKLFGTGYVMTFVSVVGFTAACSSALPAHEEVDQEHVGEVAQKIDTICGSSAVASIDGIPAYSYCGNFDVWSNNGVDVRATPGAGSGWVQSEAGYGFQCFELAARYMHFKWHVPAAWGVLYASQMCNTHPAGVSVTTKPVHGDLIVFAGGSCGIAAPAGHVAVVDSVGASTVTAVQQNVATTLTWQKSCASCFLHANANGSNDPCAPALDGFYCAASPQFAGGKKNDYYDCRGGVTKSKVACAGGCEVSPPGVEDICHRTPPPADAGAPASAAGPAPSEDPSGGDPPDVIEPIATSDVAGSPDGAQPESTEPRGSGGCSTSSRAAASNPAWLLLVLGAALARGRRAR